MYAMYTCMICEDESPPEEIERWKCETCVFECHKKCMKKWVQSSLNNGGDGNCPYCRSPITTLQSVYTRKEVLAMLFVLCISKDALPNPHSVHHTHATPFLASGITSLD